MSEHPDVEAAAIFCVDPRFLETHLQELRRLRDDDFEGRLIDPIGSAGAAASLVVGDDFGTGVLANLGASAKLHDIDTVAIIQHEDCGYCKLQATEGGNADFQFTPETEKEQLAAIARRAGAKIEEMLPDIRCVYRYAKLDGTVEDL